MSSARCAPRELHVRQSCCSAVAAQRIAPGSWETTELPTDCNKLRADRCPLHPTGRPFALMRRYRGSSCHSVGSVLASVSDGRLLLIRILLRTDDPHAVLRGLFSYPHKSPFSAPPALPNCGHLFRSVYQGRKGSRRSCKRREEGEPASSAGLATIQRRRSA